MKIPSKETLEAFLADYCSSYCLDDEEDRKRAADKLHAYLTGYNHSSTLSLPSEEGTGNHQICATCKLPSLS